MKHLILQGLKTGGAIKLGHSIHLVKKPTSYIGSGAQRRNEIITPILQKEQIESIKPKKVALKFRR